MERRAHLNVRFLLVACLVFPLFGQAPEAALSNDQIIERAYPSVTLVLTGRIPGETAAVGAAVVVRQNGILLTAYHVVKDAYAVQVRFKSGEIFDQVQLLGVDVRHDVAAIKISAAALPALPVAVAAQAKAGDSVCVVSIQPRCHGRLRLGLSLHSGLPTRFQARVAATG